MAFLLREHLRRPLPPAPSGPARQPGSETAPEPQRVDAESLSGLCCRACGIRITYPEARIAVAGSHQHHFVNPGGASFHIGCFDRAPGCHASGKAFREWSWFAGYAWRVGLCAGCRAHLGWRYESMNADVFFGIIVAQLAPCTHAGDPGADAAP